MKVIEDAPEDRYGRYPLIFSGYRNISEVYEWLWNHYQGYHFCMMFDCTKDEFEPIDNKLYVYFSDEALEEIAYISGYKIVKDDRRSWQQ